MALESDRLRGVALFEGLPDGDLERIGTWMEARSVDQGAEIAGEGNAGYTFFVIETGHADVRHDGRTIATLGPGEHFGEMAILGTGRRVATVVAASPMVLLAMFGLEFRQMESAFPTVAARLRASMDERLEAGRGNPG